MIRINQQPRNIRGATLLELLIALFLLGIVSLAAFQFYSSLNQQVITQQEICDIQQASRACLEEISTVLRSAGSGLSGHKAFETSGDTLFVYMRGVTPVDTIMFFLQEFSDAEYASMMKGHVSET